MENDSLLGKILLKNYKLKKKIGEGSFGKIYIASHIDTKVEYAIKLVIIKIYNNIIFYNKNKYIGKKRNTKKFIRNRSLSFMSFKSFWDTRSNEIW